jgi:histone H3/H4
VVVSGSGRLDPRPPDEVLVVASKVKAYIRARSGMNTSAGVMDALSEQVRKLCDDAIRTAMKNDRKTVLDRDVR